MLRPFRAKKLVQLFCVAPEDLYKEGKNLNHCVNTYANKCFEGSSTIVSLRYNDKYRVTIEINPRTMYIVQVKGRFNRQANSQEQRVISQWAKKFLMNF